MARRHDHSFHIGAPNGGLFSLFLPSGVGDGADYFRRCGETFVHQNGDRMGLSPALRLLPLLAMLVACGAAVAVAGIAIHYGERLSGVEVLATLGLGVVLCGLIGITSWLLKDLTHAVIIDRHQRILWLGGGWLARWQAINFSILDRVDYTRSAADDEAEFPWTVRVIDLDGERYRICDEMSGELARRAAGEVAERIGLPLADDGSTHA